jgi:hypothetical protein
MGHCNSQAWMTDPFAELDPLRMCFVKTNSRSFPISDLHWLYLFKQSPETQGNQDQKHMLTPRCPNQG